jgi:hypothetical protein
MSELMPLNLSSAEFAEASARFTAGKVNEDDLNLMRIINAFQDRLPLLRPLQ